MDNDYGLDPHVPRLIDQARIVIALAVLRALFPRRTRSVEGAELQLYRAPSRSPQASPAPPAFPPEAQGIRLFPGYSTRPDECLIPVQVS